MLKAKTLESSCNQLPNYSDAIVPPIRIGIADIDPFSRSRLSEESDI